MTGNASWISRRRTSMSVHIVLAFGIASGLWLLGFPEGKYSGWNYDKIHDGMTLREVQSLLGGPGEDTSNGRRYYHKPGTARDLVIRHVAWEEPGGSGYIIVALDKDDRVCGKLMFQPSL